MQRRSLQWMLQQERCDLVGNGASTSAPAVPDHEQHWHGLHLKIASFDVATGTPQPLYIDRLTGGVTTNGPVEPEQLPGGAILFLCPPLVDFRAVGHVSDTCPLASSASLRV